MAYIWGVRGVVNVNILCKHAAQRWYRSVWVLSQSQWVCVCLWSKVVTAAPPVCALAPALNNLTVRTDLRAAPAQRHIQDGSTSQKAPWTARNSIVWKSLCLTYDPQLLNAVSVACAIKARGRCQIHLYINALQPHAPGSVAHSFKRSLFVWN